VETKKMTLRPLQDRILIRRVEAETKTPGGIFIPDTAQEKPVEGEVLAVGPGKRGDDGKLQPLDIKTGDRVLFGKWSGSEIKVDGEDLIIMNETDIMGVIDDAVATRKAA
jgi:chaperonin GroES